MPRYDYVALDGRGKETRGSIDVASQNEAISRVKDMGLFPTKIAEGAKVQDKSAKKKAKSKPGAKGGKKGGGMSIEINIPGLSGRVKPKVLTTFTRQLATLVDAGLPLLRGLRVLEKQERNVTLKRILSDLAMAIEGGSTFSEALAQHPKVFNRLFINMVKAGELGGVLEVVLKEDQGQGQGGDVLSRGRVDCRHRHHDPADGVCHSAVQGRFCRHEHQDAVVHHVRDGHQRRHPASHFAGVGVACGGRRDFPHHH
jgi:hypothetical protein